MHHSRRITLRGPSALLEKSLDGRKKQRKSTFITVTCVAMLSCAGVAGWANKSQARYELIRGETYDVDSPVQQHVICYRAH